MCHNKAETIKTVESKYKSILIEIIFFHTTVACLTWSLYVVQCGSNWMTIEF